MKLFVRFCDILFHQVHIFPDRRISNGSNAISFKSQAIYSRLESIYLNVWFESSHDSNREPGSNTVTLQRLFMCSNFLHLISLSLDFWWSYLIYRMYIICRMCKSSIQYFLSSCNRWNMLLRNHGLTCVMIRVKKVVWKGSVSRSISVFQFRSNPITHDFVPFNLGPCNWKWSSKCFESCIWHRCVIVRNCYLIIIFCTFNQVDELLCRLWFTLWWYQGMNVSRNECIKEWMYQIMNVSRNEGSGRIESDER